jgi:DNA-binding NarL/FixJ family response regulator
MTYVTLLVGIDELELTLNSLDARGCYLRNVLPHKTLTSTKYTIVAVERKKPAAPVVDVSQRLVILRRKAEGKSVRAIADELHLSPSKVQRTITRNRD